MQKIMRIVLIDDDEDLCDLLTMELERSGRFLVTTSTQSETALELIKTERPDLAILDINMPEIHGVELATTLAQDPQTAGIPHSLSHGHGQPGRSEPDRRRPFPPNPDLQAITNS